MGSRVDFLREKCDGLICVVVLLIFSASCAAAGVFYLLNPVDPRHDEFSLGPLCRNLSFGLIFLAIAGLIVAMWSIVTMAVRYSEAHAGEEEDEQA